MWRINPPHPLLPTTNPNPLPDPRATNAHNPPHPLSNPKLYASVWDSYNRWLLDQMVRRKGGDSPNFGNFSWEFFSKATDPTAEEAYQVRERERESASAKSGGRAEELRLLDIDGARADEGRR